MASDDDLPEWMQHTHGSIAPGLDAVRVPVSSGAVVALANLLPSPAYGALAHLEEHSTRTQRAFLALGCPREAARLAAAATLRAVHAEASCRPGPTVAEVERFVDALDAEVMRILRGGG